MKIAVPVRDETLKIFGNAGHTPYFAVYAVNGSGMFRTVKLEGLRENPRANLEAEGGCHHEHGDHECDHDAEAHKNEHRVMADILKDCDHLVVTKACKNTKLVMEEAGIKVSAVQGHTGAGELVSAFLKKKAA
ncbi:MAG: NifB/NifX family molybdenum-iron cluster-binding protein [Campylobacterales bacterium]